MTYRIKLDVFEGPFDLLLHLIKINEMDIYDIKIAEITKQYLEYIHLMEELDLELAGEYLVMAATLINIKSRTLLPPREGEEIEDEIDEIMSTKELIRQLVEYRKYKELAQSLRSRESQNLNIFYRTNIIPILPYLEQEEDVIKEDIKRLFDAFARVVTFIEKKPYHYVSSEKYTVDDKIILIRTQLESAEQILLHKLFENCFHKLEIIVTFLATLELVRLKEIKILQSGLFKEIYIQRRLSEEREQGVIEIAEELMSLKTNTTQQKIADGGSEVNIIEIVDDKNDLKQSKEQKESAERKPKEDLKSPSKDNCENGEKR